MSKPPTPDAPATARPSVSNISWAGGIFQQAGIIEIADLSLVVRLAQKENSKEILDAFLAFFGGRIYPVPPTPKPPTKRFEWAVRGDRAFGVLQTFLPFLTRSRQTDAADLIAKATFLFNGLASKTLPSPLPAQASRKRDVIVIPRHHMELRPGYDESVFLNVEDVQPGEAYVFRLSDATMIEPFVAEATSRSYIVLSQVELTVSLTRPDDFA